MFSTMRSAAVLAIGGLLATAMIGAAAEPTEVTGESNCVEVGGAVWSGEPISGLPGSRETNYIQECSTTSSDERFSGDTYNVVTCDFSVDGEATVGTCWGTVTIHNERGAWGGSFSGTTSWSDAAPAHLHVIDLDYLGAGDYEGLRFKGVITGTDFPWTITGTIE